MMDSQKTMTSTKHRPVSFAIIGATSVMMVRNSVPLKDANEIANVCEHGMIDFLDAAKFMLWLKTAQIHANVGQVLEDSDEGLDGPGLIFDDKTYIRIHVEDEASEFRTIAGREEFQSVELMEIIEWIWENHARENAG